MKVGFGLYKNSLNKDNYQFVNQIGATHIVAHLTNYFSGNNPKISSGNDNGWGICENEPIWDIELLSGLKNELEEYGLDFTLLRYGSLYGPRAQDWNGINSFIKQIVNEGKLDYFGSGEEKREYIHVSDAADLSLEILSKDYANKAITITGLQVLNSKELIDMIFEIVGKDPVVRMNKKKNDDHYVKTPYRHSVMHARKLTPKSFVDIGQGILEIIDSLKESSHNES